MLERRITVNAEIYAPSWYLSVVTEQQITIITQKPQLHSMVRRAMQPPKSAYAKPAPAFESPQFSEHVYLCILSNGEFSRPHDASPRRHHSYQLLP